MKFGGPSSKGMGKLPGMSGIAMNAPKKYPVKSVATSMHPLVPMSPSMLTSIKNSPKGQVPGGLINFLKKRKTNKLQGGF